MERMKAIKKNRKLHKKFYRAMGGFLITLVLLCAAGGNLFAKYYAGQKNKGVGVASSLYFSSNVLKNVASTEDTTDYPMIFNKEAWNGTDECEIEVDIRNYANQLLYNDKNLDITYQISFQLFLRVLLLFSQLPAVVQVFRLSVQHVFLYEIFSVQVKAL